jgi:hypothetical protein
MVKVPAGITGLFKFTQKLQQRHPLDQPDATLFPLEHACQLLSILLNGCATTEDRHRAGAQKRTITVPQI